MKMCVRHNVLHRVGAVNGYWAVAKRSGVKPGNLRLFMLVYGYHFFLRSSMHSKCWQNT